MDDRLAAGKFELLREIFGLAQEQRAALEGRDTELFADLLGERDNLIERLELLADDELLPENVIPFPAADPAAKAQDAIALDSLINSILNQDRENESTLVEHMDELRTTLPELDRAKRAARRYRVHESLPRFIDRAS